MKMLHPLSMVHVIAVIHYNNGDMDFPIRETSNSGLKIHWAPKNPQQLGPISHQVF